MAKKRTASGGGVSSRRSRVEFKPIAGPEAFEDLSESSHVLSQAATMLLIGSHLRGDAAAVEARAQVSVGLAAPDVRSRPAAALPEEDIAALGFPRLQADSGRFHAADLQGTLGVRFSASPRTTPTDTRAAAKTLPDAARTFYRDANKQTAAALLEVGLHHPNELVRVAAAASYFEVGANAFKAIAVLEHGLSSKDLLTRDVAAYALAHIDPANPRLQKLAKAKRRISRRKPSHTSTIVHGTWAASSGWWQPPSGDFWTYLHDKVDPSLYGAQDRFGWTGGYSDAARTKGGIDLKNWVQTHQLDGLDLYGHSHGCSVSMVANQLGTGVGQMVLLSCPVHWPKYAPDFTRVTKVVSVRVHMDLVILADRGGQKFTDSRIDEHVLPVWFDHFATHDPAVWDKYNVKQWVLGAAPLAPAAAKPPDLGAVFHTGLEKPMRVKRPIKYKPRPT
jgi:predicted alpha/beta-hydrolase family hydrolase